MSDVAKHRYDTSSVVTIKLNTKSEDAMEVYAFLKHYKRKQGRFLTALLSWYIHQDRLYYDEKNDKIIDLKSLGLTTEEINVIKNKNSKVMELLGLPVKTNNVNVSSDTVNEKESTIAKAKEEEIANESEPETAKDFDEASNVVVEAATIDNVPSTSEPHKVNENVAENSNSDSDALDDEDNDDFDFYSQMASF